MKSAAAKKCRVGAKEAIDCLMLDTIPWKKARVTPVLFHKTKRRRDSDNAIAMLKPIYDGIVDAGVVQDDTPEYMERAEPSFEIDKESPHVLLLVEIIAAIGRE